MKSPELIVMLTNKDVTVADSLEIFNQTKDASAKNWGFKNVGLPENEMKKLAYEMKKAGKTTFFEVLEDEEKRSIYNARLAVQMGFDYLLSLKYFPSVHEILDKGNVCYVPFVGKPENGKIYGSIEEITEQVKMLQKMGVFGVNLSAFRYEGDYKKLVARVMENIKISVCMAGSVNSYTRLDEIKEFKPWSFTIGGAFFDHVFGDYFSEQIENVTHYLNTLTPHAKT